MWVSKNREAEPVLNWCDAGRCLIIYGLVGDHAKVMRKKISMISTLIALFISWLLPVWTIIENQRSPSYESALGVVYGMGIGLAIHILVVIIWCITNRKNLNTTQLVILFISVLLMFSGVAINHKVAGT
jgi:hypothetical protein